MVTSVTNIQVSKGGHDYTYCELEGLSTDAKPTTGIFNGSSFFEMDTSKGYKFDAANMQWRQVF